ncbi:adenine deaminase C-terminal domain-containing protein [Nocardia miyunensis]|uniref:adenine deaminase C-terminal domain-containing protein n=1 Tax=Nocardia miyunensis TaxID=282684 RepID=UPI0008374E1E|nr:adenine deaminase C-terminal domain-containing protein [Nocardia miyunensis]
MKPAEWAPLVDTALGRRPADRILQGGSVLFTPTGEIRPADVAVVGDRVAFVGDCADLRNSDTDVVDVTGAFLLPGFIDGHLHPENSRLAPHAVAETLVPAGTTSIVTGLDHTAAAGGIDGVRRALDMFAATHLNVLWASPFRLPYTVPAASTPEPWGIEQQQTAMAWPECVGVWELCPGFVEQHDAVTTAAIAEAARRNLGIYGSVPCADRDLRVVAAHVAAGLSVDHEAFDIEELRAKLRLGLYALLRDSPVEPFLPILIGLVTDDPQLSHSIGFCTDEFAAADVMLRGHVNRLVRDAVALGLPARTAAQMATINTARMYRVDDRVGSIAPGRRADILVCDDLTEFVPRMVFAQGRLAARDGVYLGDEEDPPRSAQSVTAVPFERPVITSDDVTIGATVDGDIPALVIELTDNAFHRKASTITVPVRGGTVRVDKADDLCIAAYVVRKPRDRRPPGLGLVTGFGLTSGAIATSCSPDDENILCVGRTPADVALAINTVIRHGGGDVVVDQGEVVHLLPLPVEGIMSALSLAEYLDAEARLENAARRLGCRVEHPMMVLGILGITGTPEIGLSEYGVVDYSKRAVVPLFASPVHP